MKDYSDEEEALNGDFISALLDSVQAFNDLREKHSEFIPDLHGLPSCRDLTGVNFSGMHFIDDIFDELILREADLRGIKTPGCEFYNSDFTNAKMEGATISWVALKNCTFKGTSFDHLTEKDK